MKQYFAIDKIPQLIQFSQTTTGKLVALLIFSSELYLLCPWWPIIMGILTPMTYLPQYRRVLLLLGTIFLLTQNIWFQEWPDWQAYTQYINNKVSAGHHWLETCSLIATITLSSIIIFLRRPLSNLFIVIFTLIVMAAYLPFSTLEKMYLWAFIIVFGHYLWFVGYTLMERNPLNNRKTIFEYSFYLPFWGSSNTPLPKGAAYLNKIEASTSHALAITQLKAIKLLYWALTLKIIFTVINNGRNYFHIPLLEQALAQYAQGVRYPFYFAWLCLLINFSLVLLNLCVWGHTIIAICRMAGFMALRNTYKSLQATTLAEFWNRYFFYFKELLVEFFFYPTYFRFFKNSPRLRLFFATLVAATFGNILYHFLANLQYVAQLGLLVALKSFYIYIFYAMILGIAIALSQLRNLSKQPPSFWLQRYVTAPLFVVCFYLILSVFDTPYQSTNILNNFNFIESLFTP